MQNIYLWDFYTLWEGILISANKTLKKTCKKDVQLFIGLLLTICFSLFNNSVAQEPRRDGAYGSNQIEGVVLSSDTGEPVENATVSSGRRTTRTNQDGLFTIDIPSNDTSLHIRHLGFRDTTIVLTESPNDQIIISIVPVANTIDEVEVVSTGYQKISKERATGSFSTINQKMLERRVSTNILDRLDGMASGLNTNTKKIVRGQSVVEVRGKSTLYSNSDPLIVLDDFPYEGDLESINPNDIENITVLKDAAAASIWGVRASNGVIVITTKTAKQGARPTIEFGSNQSFSGKRNIFDRPMLSSSEYIEIERFLFEKGKYDATLNRGYAPVSPVIEILSQIRAGEVNEENGSHQLDELATIDVRDEFNRYFNRGRHEQQYNISARGSGNRHNYFVSAGYDRNRKHEIGQQFHRWTIQSSNTYTFWNDRISVNHRLLYSNATHSSNTHNQPSEPLYPYSRYVDHDGNYLPEGGNLRLSYIDNLTETRLLDWHHRPLQSLTDGDYQYVRKNNNLRNTLRLDARITDGLTISASYLNEQDIFDSPTYYGPNSYYARDLINKFSHVDSDGNLNYGIPVGGILDVNTRSGGHQSGRLQAIFDRDFSPKHHLSAVIGSEIRENRLSSNRNGLYGYNEANQTHQNHNVDYVTPFKMWHSGNSSRIATLTSRSSTLDRFISYYSNFMYAFDDRYRISLSLRRDGSNLFGVDANRKFVPLWSIGTLWDVHKEKFFSNDLINKLQLRSSFGYNGNINKSVSAYLTAKEGSTVSYYGQPFFEIVNPPNPSLQWERVANLNLGLSTALLNNRLSFSVEYWQKRALDLIANRPVATQAGVAEFLGNSASTKSQGWDITIESSNLSGQFKWQSQAFIGFSKSYVSNIHGLEATNYSILSNIYDHPQIGYSQFALFAFPMKGLSNQGDPIGYLENEESQDYRSIKNQQDLSDLNYLGSTVPTMNATLWNHFTYKGLDLSFSLRWYSGHFFRRNSLNNMDLYNNRYSVWDYDQQWQEPGDELTTNVPALIYPANINRNDFYKYSDVLIEKGDHLRLQDIQLSIETRKWIKASGFTSLKVKLSVTDVGLIWKSNNNGVDPLYVNGNPIRPTYSFGLHLKI